MRKVALAVGSALVLIVGSFGCSAGNERAGAGGNGSGSGTGSGQGGEIDITTSGAGGAGPSTDCDEAATYVYVLSEENSLYRFKPVEKVFELIGPIQCPTSMMPNSMAVDRGATAWVNYVDSDFTGDIAGQLFKVSTKDASCTGPITNLPVDWYRLGMGFSTDQADGAAEQLYVTGTSGTIGGASPGLGRIDTTTLALSSIGPFNGSLSGQNAELTGTGDARLFGFFTTTPVQVAELDKGTGGILSQTSMNGVETPFAWAFSFWGGDFYLYTAPDPSLYPNRTSNVTKYRPSDGSVDPNYMTNVGFRIVGAGVSTCAPVIEPN